MSNRLKSFALASLVFSLTCGVGLAASDVVVKHTLAQTAISSDGKGEADKLFQDGVQQFRRGEYPKALQTYQRVLEIRRKLGDKAGIGQTLNNIGQVYNSLQQNDKALEILQQALTIRREIKDRAGEGETLDILGAVYLILEQDEKSLETLQQALAIRREVKDRNGEAATLSKMGFTYVFLKKQEQGLKLLQEALALHQELKDKFQEGFTLFRIGQVYWNADDYPRALEWYNKSLTVNREVGNRAVEGRSLQQIGTMYFKLEKYEQAIQYYQQALPLIREAGISPAEESIIASIGDVLNNLKQYDRNIAFYQQELDNARKSNNKSLQGNILKWIGNTYFKQEKYHHALEFFQQALVLVPEVKEKDFKANIVAAIGDLYFRQKQYQQAIDFYQQAIVAIKEAGDTNFEAKIINQIGSCYFLQEQYDSALKFYQQALSVARKAKNESLEIDVLSYIGDTYGAQKQYDRAIAFYQQELQTAQKADKKLLKGNIIFFIGNSYFNKDEQTHALELYKQALTIFKDVNARQMELNTMIRTMQSQYLIAFYLYKNKKYYAAINESTRIINLAPVILDIAIKSQLKIDKNEIRKIQSAAYTLTGNIYIDLADLKKAQKFTEQGLNIAQQSENLEAENLALSVLTIIYNSLGNQSKTIELNQRQLKIAQQLKNPIGEVQALLNIANTYLLLGNYQKSIELTQQALTKIKVVDISKLPENLQTNAWQTQSLVLKMFDAYRQYADLLLKQGRTAEAQQVLDLINVRDLRETRTQAKNNSLIALGLKIQECEQKKCPTNEKSQLLDQVEVINTQYDRDLKVIEEEIRTRIAKDDGSFDPRYKSKAKEIVEAQPGTVMISPFVLKDKVWLLLTAPGGVHKAFEVKVSREELGKAVQEFRDLMKYCETPGIVCTNADIPKIQLASQKLYNWLIKPLETELKANPVKHLVFALDRVTRYVPMSALYDGKQYLIEKYSIQNILSSTLTDINKSNLTATKETQVLAMGVSDSVKQFPALPNVKQEIETILRIYPGLNFLNKQFDFLTLRNNVSGKQILHLATHGEFVSNKKDKTYESFLLLGTGDYLTIPLIQKLPDLGNVNLVVLSACRSALADSLGQDGIEINSTAHEFMVKGAKSVIASLWLVSDKSTSQIMQEFYKNLATGKMTKSEALRQAQLSLLKGEKSQVGDDKKRAPGGLVPVAEPENPSKNREAANYSHPYYWAPFILIGNGL
jgi:CHAT domain-containing protein/uncharacterized protein HemY